MLVPLDKFDQAYRSIKTDALESDCTVLLFVAADADALSAAWILVTLLRADFISYRLVPVNNMDALIAAREELKAAPGAIKSIIMINAGANRNVLRLFEAEDDSESGLAHLKFYIIDSHRPVNLVNLYEPERVLVFDDGRIQERIPELRDVVYNPDADPVDAFNSDSDDDEQQLDGDDDDDMQDDGDEGVGDDDDDGDEGAGVDEATGEPVAQRPRRERRALSPGARAANRRANWRRRRDNTRTYYMQAYNGPAASTLMWQLAGDLNKSSNHLLWLAIVGVTDQYLHERIDAELYAECVHNLGSDVGRMNVDDAAEDREAVGRMTIKPSSELRFMLLRHWTLFEAMYHSRFVAARLGVWRSKGKDRLKDLLAKMGISLEQSHQKYSAMDVRIRDTLHDQMLRFGDEFGLEDCAMDSFVAQTGFTAPLSASDVVFAVTALLEAPAPGGNWKSNFYKAFDALSPVGGFPLLMEGMEGARQQHMALLRLVESTVDGANSVRKLKDYRYAIIENVAGSEILLHPIMLAKLAHFLLDTYKYNQDSKKKTLPLMVAARNPVSEKCLIVGVWANARRRRPRDEDDEDGAEPNEFGYYFRKAAQRIAARICATNFDASVVEVQRDDMGLFVTSLQQRLAQQAAAGGGRMGAA